MLQNDDDDNDREEKETLINLPRNYFEPTVFANEESLPERHEYEQFFWTRETVEKLIGAFNFLSDAEGDSCCLTTPSLAEAWHQMGRDEVLLDIDDRFDYLPRFHYYDVRVPRRVDEEQNQRPFRLLVLDPPFFVVPIEQFRVAVDLLTDNNHDTKLVVGFIKRQEKRLLEAFADYGLQRTNFPLQYASIKKNKWANFALYSNVDLPGIRRVSRH